MSHSRQETGFTDEGGTVSEALFPLETVSHKTVQGSVSGGETWPVSSGRRKVRGHL